MNLVNKTIHLLPTVLKISFRQLKLSITVDYFDDLAFQRMGNDIAACSSRIRFSALNYI